MPRLYCNDTSLRPSLKIGFSQLRDFTIEQRVFYSPVPSLDIAVLNEPPILESPSDRSSTNKFSTGIGWWWQRIMLTNQSAKWTSEQQNVFPQNVQEIFAVFAFLVNCAWRSGRKEKSAKYLLDFLRLRAVSLLLEKSAGKNAKKNITHKRAVCYERACYMRSRDPQAVRRVFRRARYLRLVASSLVARMSRSQSRSQSRSHAHLYCVLPHGFSSKRETARHLGFSHSMFTNFKLGSKSR